MEKIARERGDMLAGLDARMEEKDRELEELAAKLAECEAKEGKSDDDYKGKLDRKSKVCKVCERCV